MGVVGNSSGKNIVSDLIIQIRRNQSFRTFARENFGVRSSLNDLPYFEFEAYGWLNRRTVTEFLTKKHVNSRHPISNKIILDAHHLDSSVSEQDLLSMMKEDLKFAPCNQDRRADDGTITLATESKGYLWTIDKFCDLIDRLSTKYACREAKITP